MVAIYAKQIRFNSDAEYKRLAYLAKVFLQCDELGCCNVDYDLITGLTSLCWVFNPRVDF